MALGKKIKEAIAIAKLNGKDIDQNSLGSMIWEGSKPQTVSVNMSKLTNGKTLTFKEEWIHIICKECGVTATFLFGV